ncbi:MAG: hypothetical protein KatS3mg087_0859 [Patescibacteria group bacterium]|nr:MAG: hypothetical protein KatS3mg087_0859 [Patescibacteria group bacterium]
MRDETWYDRTSVYQSWDSAIVPVITADVYFDDGNGERYIRTQTWQIGEALAAPSAQWILDNCPQPEKDEPPPPDGKIELTKEVETFRA